MSVIHKETSIAAIKKRDAEKSKIITDATSANGVISITVADGVTTGTLVKFISPCSCVGITALNINGKSYSFVDAAGHVISDISGTTGGVFVAGAAVSVIINEENSTAVIQNPAKVDAATKLAAARNINGLSFDGSANRVSYGTCGTAAATAAKVVACAGFELITGAMIMVRFTVTNTAASPTLNVNSTGAKAIRYRNAAISAGYLAANRTYLFVYDGTYYQLVGDLDTNTTYTLASLGAAPLASPTFTGTPKTTANTSYGTAQLRNIHAGTSAMTAGTSALANGAIYIQYS